MIVTTTPITEPEDPTIGPNSISGSSFEYAVPDSVSASKSLDGQQSHSGKKRPKDWDSMTVVWTSENGLAKGPRPKRTMTEEERKEYQLRRVRGACVSCKKKKRKVWWCSLRCSVNNTYFLSAIMTLPDLKMTRGMTGMAATIFCPLSCIPYYLCGIFCKILRNPQVS